MMQNNNSDLLQRAIAVLLLCYFLFLHMPLLSCTCHSDVRLNPFKVKHNLNQRVAIIIMIDRDENDKLKQTWNRRESNGSGKRSCRKKRLPCFEKKIWETISYSHSDDCGLRNNTYKQELLKDLIYQNTTLIFLYYILIAKFEISYFIWW